MAKIIVFGAGFVAGPAIDFLVEQGHQITLANFDLAEAEKVAQGRPQIAVVKADVTNAEEVAELVNGHQVAISLVPYTFHYGIAQACIQQKVHLVTASYESEQMRSLNQAAEAAGVAILNEIGLDPGIDHLTAMQVIDAAHERGAQVEKFISWCGGLPAPQSNNNPLGYKFSWSPRAVLLALLNNAQYIADGQVKTTAQMQLLQDKTEVVFSDDLVLEGYPNRDSVSYQDIYRIPEAQTVFRGTLRYPGFCELFQFFKQQGLIIEESLPQGVTTWKQLMQAQGIVEDSIDSDYVKHCMQWLGMFEEAEIGNTASKLDALAQLLMGKLSYQADEQDMTAMQHQFVIKEADGRRKKVTSTMVVEGEPGGYFAMAKTVGIPVAAAAHLLTTGEMQFSGSKVPVTKDIYAPLLAILAQKGIAMTESEQEL